MCLHGQFPGKYVKLWHSLVFCIPVILPIDLRLMESLNEQFDPYWMAPAVFFFMRDCLTGTGLTRVDIFVL